MGHSTAHLSLLLDFIFFLIRKVGAFYQLLPSPPLAAIILKVFISPPHLAVSIHTVTSNALAAGRMPLLNPFNTYNTCNTDHSHILSSIREKE